MFIIYDLVKIDFIILFIIACNHHAYNLATFKFLFKNFILHLIFMNLLQLLIVS